MRNLTSEKSDDSRLSCCPVRQASVVEAHAESASAATAPTRSACVRFDGIPAPPPWATGKKRPPSKRRHQDCMDCGVDTSFATGIGHYYTVTKEVWDSVVSTRRGMLCLDCLQVRLGRPLADADFVATPSEILERMLPPEAKDGKPFAQYLDDEWERDCQLRLPL